MTRKKSPIADRKTIFTKTGGEDEPAVEEPTLPRQKRTYHIPSDVVLLLNEIQLSEYRKTGEKPELSDLVAEAIRQLASNRLDSQST